MRYPIALSFIPEPSQLELGARYLPNFEKDPAGFLLTVDPACGEPVSILLSGGSLAWQTTEVYEAETPLLGRPFIHKRFDCYTFLRDACLRDFEIVLPDVEYEADWWLHGKDLYMDNVRQAGFTIKPPSAGLQVGDVLAIKLRASAVNHTALYVGSGNIAHHCSGALSRIEPLRPAFWRFCEGVYRHESLL